MVPSPAASPPAPLPPAEHCEPAWTVPRRGGVTSARAHGNMRPGVARLTHMRPQFAVSLTQGSLTQGSLTQGSLANGSLGAASFSRTPTRATLVRAALLRTVLLATLLGGALPGCQCSEERPYTPFRVASSLPEELTPVASGSAPQLAPERPRRVLEARGQPERFAPFGVELVAPKEFGFVSAIELLAPSGEPRGPTEALGWLVPRGKKGSARLVQFDRAGRAERTLVERPGFLPSDRSCEDDLVLTPLGERAVALRIVTQCATQLLPGSATGAFIIVDPDRALGSGGANPDATAKGATLLTFRTLADYPDEKLGLRAALGDRDGDGSPDLSLEVGISLRGTPSESLEFAWLLRPLGPSRITDSPRRAFTERAKALSGAVPRKAERERAVAGLEALRRTVLGACAEAGTPRITLADGTPLGCDLESTFHELTTGIVNARVYQDELGGALGEYHRAPSYLGAPSAADDVRMQKYLARSITMTTAEVLGVHPLPPERTALLPTMSPLRFDGARLLALVGGQVIVVHEVGKQATGALPTVDDQVDGAIEGGAPVPPPPPALPEPWGLVPKSPSGLVVGGAVPSCDRAEVVLLLTDERGAPRERRALAQLAPRPGHCGSFGGALPVEPIVFQGASPLVVVGGELTLAGEGAEVNGTFAHATRAGLAVIDGTKLTVLGGSGLEQAHRCQVHPARTEVACVRGSDVVRVKYAP